MVRSSTLRFLVILLAFAFTAVGCGGGSSGGGASGTNPTADPAVGTLPDTPDTEVPPQGEQTGGAPEPELAVRAIDGTGAASPEDERGSAGAELIRLAPAGYADGSSSLAGLGLPSARAVSNAVCAQEEPMASAAGLTDYVWQWGQFLDHDITLTPEADPDEQADIPVPAFDPWFDPDGTGAVTLTFHRSAWSQSGEIRQQVNAITAFIDASNVYGSDAERADALRTLDGTGRLRTSEGDLLPKNLDGLPNAGGTDADLFVAGDVRANEQVALTAMHTLFVREHNRVADEIRSRDPGLSGEEVYQEARRFVGALMQVITYREFLPALLGPAPLSPYAGYRPEADPGIVNEFSTGCYRLGHSMLSSTIRRIDASGGEISEGHLALRDAFFHPELLSSESDLDPILRGLASQAMQEIDSRIIDDVRNFLFGSPGAGGLDLAALNIQRGRDHGLPGLNEVRAAYGLAAIGSFEDLTADPEVIARLSSVYVTVDEIDPWIGALAEDDLAGAEVGRLLDAAIRDQFRRLRDGDPFWYRLIFDGEALAELEQTRLSDVIRRNTGIGNELPDDVFQIGPGEAVPAGPPPPPEEVGADRRRRIERGMR